MNWMNKTEKEKQLAIAKDCLLDELEEIDDIVEDLLDVYDEAAERVKADIQRSLIRFAENNEISIEEAKGLLSSKEFTKWKKSIEEYIEQIEKEADGTKMLMELNTLSAKTSISRKEELLSQIDKEMMTLANKTTRSILASYLSTTIIGVSILFKKQSAWDLTWQDLILNLLKVFLNTHGQQKFILKRFGITLTN